MKKILTAALVCAVSAFAAWDYFPVIEKDKGEAKISGFKSRQGSYESDNGIDFGVRFSPLAKLELQSWWGGVDGDYTLGARYQVIPVLAFGVDFGFPIAQTAWSFSPAIQFSMPLGSALALGSNLGATIYTEDVDKYTRGLDLDFGLELDVNLNKKITIWVGCDLSMGLGESSIDGNPDPIEIDDERRAALVSPAIGYIFSLDNLSLGTAVKFDFGDKFAPYTDRTSVIVDATVKF